MQGTDLLRMQLQGSCDLIEAHVQSSAGCWTQRAFPGTSRPGFILWHCARIIDWAVQTVVRGEPEVGAGDAWRERIHHDLGHGVGLTDQEADSVADTVTPHDVAAYTQAVRETVLGWLGGVSDDDLDRVPDLRAANARHPRYATPAAWAEVEGLEGVPAWQVLARPSGAHIRVHMGELDTLCAAIRLGVHTAS